jgi:hypothetical protein
MRAMPTAVEPDVMRTLQGMNGGVVLNDLNAQLYVRGGAPDQNQVLLDGAPVFGAYHMFGMAGAFNPDAVRRVDFYRGQQSARHGGALSSVIEVEQRDGSTPFLEGGLSFMGARFAGGGRTLDDRLSWMLATRRTHVDAFMGKEMPVAYRDAHLRLGFAADSVQELVLSGFASSDRFAFGNKDPDGLQSAWSNAVGSLRWSRALREWQVGSTAWASNYRASMYMGGDDQASRTDDDVMSLGVRADAARSLAAGRARVGLEVHRLSVELRGAKLDGGYFTGVFRRARFASSVHAEWDRGIGRARLVPALRASLLGGVPVLEPRIAARVSVTNALTLSVGAARSFQDMSTLRDERHVLPGPAMWFVHPDGAPVSRSDAFTAELELWRGSRWQLTVAGYHKQLHDVPQWRPIGVRDLTGVSYDDGSARGIELGVRRHGDRVSGWASYTLAHTRFSNAATGAEYDAPWDRRHSANMAVLWRVMSRLQLSAQGYVGSGHPFWPFLGDVLSPTLEPLHGTLESTRTVPLWGTQQMRHVAYGRVDVGARTSFSVAGARVEPYLNLQNLSRRPNVLYYEIRGPYSWPNITSADEARLRPIAMPAFVIPTFGFNLFF